HPHSRRGDLQSSTHLFTKRTHRPNSRHKRPPNVPKLAARGDFFGHWLGLIETLLIEPQAALLRSGAAVAADVLVARQPATQIQAQD
ncbi:MAG: hypothetical protein O2968_12240, partial [Acidobacteria bacterium]|nr:hypothetical protein [Acidobacteriota bacterium]